MSGPVGIHTPLCDLLGIEHPVVGFTPSEHVAAAISRAGGLGVLGCVRFNDPAELDTVLSWMDQNTGGRPYGIDVVMPARVPAEGGQQDLSQLIPQTHKDFVEQTLLRLGVPPLPDGAQAADGVLGWLHSVARKHVEVALGHPARLIANALGPPPPDVIASAHERGMLVAALAGKAEHARRQVASGVDIVVAQGYEAGGHTGEIATMVLVPEIVDAVGAGVSHWKPGQRVGVGWHGGHCGHCDSCRSGDFFGCQVALQITGISFDGGYAEYMIAPAIALALVPEELSAVEAAPLMCAGITTYNALRNSSARPGDVVAVLGLGGLGHLGVQYAVKMGFKTVAIARGPDKEPLARKLGARHYIDSEAKDPAAGTATDR